MSKSWGIEIDTETTLDDSTIGMSYGQLRYVTGTKPYQAASIIDKSGQGNNCTPFNTPTVTHDGIEFDGTNQYAATGFDETDGASLEYHLKFKTKTITDPNNTIYDNSGATSGVDIFMGNDILTITAKNISNTRLISFTNLLDETDYLLSVNVSASDYSATLIEYSTGLTVYTQTGVPISVDQTGTNGKIAELVGGGSNGTFKLYNFKIVKNGTVVLDIEGKNTTKYLTGHNSAINLSLSGVESFTSSVTSGQIYQYSNGIYKTANTEPKHGSVITLLNTTDTSDNKFVAIKGSSLSSGDMFEFTKPTATSSIDIRYLGQSTYITNHIKDAGESSSSIDIETFGDFTFNTTCRFVLNNRNDFVNVLNGLNIQLLNKRVRFFMIEDDLSYQYYQGVIKTITEREGNNSYTCTDGFKKNHEHTMPPVVVDSKIYPNIINESNLDKRVPVVIGDVFKSKMINVTDQSDGVISRFRLISYEDNSGTSRIVADIASGQPDFTFDAGRSQFFRVISGETLDPELCDTPNTSKLYKILSASYVIVGGDGIVRYTFDFEPGFEEGTVANINAYGILVATPIPYNMFDSWWIEISDYDSKHLVSNNEIETLEIDGNPTIVYKYDRLSNKYTELRDLVDKTSTVADSESAHPYVDTTLENVLSSGETPVYNSILGFNQFLRERLDGTVISQNFVYGTGPSNPDQGNIKYFVRKEEIVIKNSINTLWCCPDITLKIKGAVAPGTATINIRYSNALTTKTNAGGEIPWFDPNQIDSFYTVGYNSGDSDIKLGFVPDFYYDDPGTGWLDYFNTFENDEVRSRGLIVPSQNYEFTEKKIYELYEINIVVTFSEDVNTFGSGDPSTIELNNFVLLTNETVNLFEENLHVDVSGELSQRPTDLPSNNVWYALYLLLEDYAKIPPDLVDYDNMSTARQNWHVGRQINNKTTTTSLIKDLAKKSFVGIVPNNFGGYKAKAWIDDEITERVFTDTTNILRDSFKNSIKTNITKIYNNITIQYAYDQGSQEFKKSYSVKNITEDSFPLETDTDAQGNLLWPQWVVGVTTEDYTAAKNVWNQFHNSWLENGVINELSNADSELKWYIDPDIEPIVAGQGSNSSSWKYLLNLGIWTSRRKNVDTFSVNADSNNILNTLLDTSEVSDQIFTNNIGRVGWITSIQVKPNSDKIEYKVISKVQDQQPIWQDTLESELPITHEDEINTITHEDTITNF